MTARAFDLGTVLGTACMTAGAYLAWGIAPALMVAGGMITALTVVGALLGRVR